MTIDSTQSSLPLAQGTWSLDPNHSGVHFKVRHLGLTNVRGRFNSFDATLIVGESLSEVSVQASVEMSSVDTNQADRDAHLRSTDFFSTEQHPIMTFQSTAVREKGGDYVMDGALTINGIERPTSFDVEFLGIETFPGDGKAHAGFSATTVVPRDEFGVDFDLPLGADKFTVGKSVTVELDLQFLSPEA